MAFGARLIKVVRLKTVEVVEVGDLVVVVEAVVVLVVVSTFVLFRPAAASKP